MQTPEPNESLHDRAMRRRAERAHKKRVAAELAKYRPDESLAIAEICGITARVFDFAAEGKRCIRTNDQGGEQVFEPYRDANDAEFALKHCFKTVWCLMLYSSSQWAVRGDFHKIDGWDECRFRGVGDTLAEAMCACIVSLGEFRKQKDAEPKPAE